MSLLVYFLYAPTVNTNSILCHISIIIYQRLFLLIAVQYEIWLLVINSQSNNRIIWQYSNSDTSIIFVVF